MGDVQMDENVGHKNETICVEWLQTVKQHKVTTPNCDLFAKSTPLNSHRKCSISIYESLGLIMKKTYF